MPLKKHVSRKIEGFWTDLLIRQIIKNCSISFYLKNVSLNESFIIILIGFNEDFSFLVNEMQFSWHTIFTFFTVKYAFMFCGSSEEFIAELALIFRTSVLWLVLFQSTLTFIDLHTMLALKRSYAKMITGKMGIEVARLGDCEFITKRTDKTEHRLLIDLFGLENYVDDSAFLRKAGLIWLNRSIIHKKWVIWKLKVSRDINFQSV